MSRRAELSPRRIVPGSAAPAAGGDVRRVAERDRLGLRGADQPHGRAPLLIPILTQKPVIPHALSMSRVYSLHQLEDPQRGQSGALRVVLVRRRDAEVRADAVSLIGLHDAAVLLDGAAHDRHALADERLGLVRREALAERGRPDDVGEQDGDRPHLVGEGRTRAEALGRSA